MSELISLCSFYASKLDYYNFEENISIYKELTNILKSIGYEIEKADEGDFNTYLQTTISTNAKTRFIIKRLKIDEDLKKQLLNKIKKDSDELKNDYSLRKSLLITLNSFL